MDGVVYYETENGNSEIRKFLQSHNKKALKGNKASVDLLDSFVYAMERYLDGMPHSSPLRKGLFELRFKDCRITYFICKGKMVLLTVFDKKSNRTPTQEFDRALKRKKDWEKRCGK
ncbi:type II toxin-antitoxin system RelE/ParE family toxin [Paenibacillus pabuli]|uniref:type II toxin-antitoxin system RelE/ParE family toxin n=1 Tax=Paenibacillus pabuli TaxID=1472 RepID=UPI003CEEE018